MPLSIALLGARDSGPHALLAGRRPRLQSTRWTARVIDDVDAWAAALAEDPPALVLLLAPRDASAEALGMQWRQRLVRDGIGFSVLYGDLQAQLDSAMRLIDAFRNDSPARAAGDASSRWAWCCDKCSDSSCEHRLFKDLLQSRARNDAAR